MEWALIAIAAIQAGFSIYQANQQQDAMRDANAQADQEAVAKQNELTNEAIRRRRARSSGGTLLGGAPSGTGNQASQQGTILTQVPQNKSLLGG